MKTQARANKNQIPYVFDYYNVACFTTSPNSAIRNVLSRIVNSMIKALNDTLKMPRIIIVIPDWDILKFVDKTQYGFGTKTMVESALTWIVEQMERAIDAKKDNLRRRRPGSIISNEPKVIWVKMLSRLNMRDNTLAFRATFNKALESTLAAKLNHYIIDPNENMFEKYYFDSNKNITAAGIQHLWNEIDQQVELFEKRKLSLKPLEANNYKRKSQSMDKDVDDREYKSKSSKYEEYRPSKRSHK